MECFKGFVEQAFVYFASPVFYVASDGWLGCSRLDAIDSQKAVYIGQGQAGVAATVYWQVAAIVGVIVGGWLADRWMRGNQRGRIYVSAIGMV